MDLMHNKSLKHHQMIELKYQSVNGANGVASVFISVI